MVCFSEKGDIEMRTFRGRATAAVMAGLLGVTMALGPVCAGIAALSPTIAYAKVGDCVQDARYGMTLTVWHNTIAVNTFRVHAKLDGRVGDIMPITLSYGAADGMTFGFVGDEIDSIVSVVVDPETGDSLVVCMPYEQWGDGSDWSVYSYSERIIGHRVNGEWQPVSNADYGISVVADQIDTELIHTLAGEPPANGAIVDGTVLFDIPDWGFEQFGGYGTPLTEDNNWVITYSDAVESTVLQHGWSTDSSHDTGYINDQGRGVAGIFVSDNGTHAPSIGAQTGSGQTDLTMIMRNTGEYGGTAEPEKNADGSDNPLYNPDSDGDGLGDNLAFTVPSSINYVVNADGSLIAPSEGVAYIENKSAFATHVSSMDVDPVAGFNFVADAEQSDANNSVDLQVGPAVDMLQASEYLEKKDVNDAIKWGMDAKGAADASKVLLKSDGDVSHITKDITEQTKFGTIKWYVTPGAAE